MHAILKTSSSRQFYYAYNTLCVLAIYSAGTGTVQYMDCWHHQCFCMQLKVGYGYLIQLLDITILTHTPRFLKDF